ncbi:MAG: class I SAM-dependent methyltransferase [Phycisphaerales bacterium]|nr:MAG: class I SAM-dependent methyltransferase [Phycisphaerales bacterium]
MTTVGMGSRIHPPPSLKRHPICRGDFLAMVFSGDRRILGELTGELTWKVRYKFALEDPRLRRADDFAASAAGVLPRWLEERVAPTGGVCFVFVDEDHPSVSRLRGAGGIEGEHFVVLENLGSDRERSGVEAQIARIPKDQTSDKRIWLLGYGEQGRRIARYLMEGLGYAGERILVVDHGLDSAKRAAEDGLKLGDETDAAGDDGPVVYSPLSRYERLHVIARRATAAGRAVVDNWHRAGTDRFFVDKGRIWADGCASRALRFDGAVVKAAEHGLEVEAVAVREDLRILGEVAVPHLHGEQLMLLREGRAGVDLSERNPSDGMADDTYRGLRRAYVGATDRAALGVFAAREFCRGFFPDAVEHVFPSRHPISLGGTAFERLILQHLERREIAMASQTSAEQAALGVLARHYAANSPIVEIGSALGGSALLMAAATEERSPQIVSIDPDTANRDVMRFVFEHEGQTDRLRQITKTSDDAIGELTDLAGRVGLVFIDGLHTEHGVANDGTNYAPLIRPGGALVFHDVHPGWYNVMRTVIERVIPDSRFTLRCLVDSLAVFERLGVG